MLYRHYRNAIHVQHFRRYLHGRYLLCSHQSDYRKGKRKEDQCADVRSCHIICTEIYFHLILTRMRSDSVKKMSAYADLNHAPGLTDVRLENYS